MNIKKMLISVIDKLPLFLLSETTAFLFLSPLVLTSGRLVNTALFTLFTAVNIFSIWALFAINRVKSLKSYGYTLIYLILAVIILLCEMIGAGEMTFLDWVLSGSGFSLQYLPYAVLIEIVSVIFASTTIFYFTRVYFRAVIIILLLFIPLCLDYVLVKELNTAEIAVLSLSLVLVIIQGLNKNIKTAKLTCTPALYRVAALFFAVVSVICLIMPKTVSAPYNSVLDNLMAYNPFESKGLVQVGTLSFESSSRSYRSIKSTRLLYTVKANESLYLKKASYLYFDDNRWHIDSSDEIVNVDICSISKHTGQEEFYDFLRTAYSQHSDIFEKYGISYSDIPSDYKDEKENARIKHEKFRAEYAISPLRSIRTTLKNNTLFQNGYGEMPLPYFSPNMEYKTEFYRDNLRESPDVAAFSNKFSYSSYNAFMYELLASDSSYARENDAAYDQYIGLYLSKKYFDANAYDSPEIKALAEEITEGLTGDYEKALALEAYFRKNGFVYDMDYIPEDESIEYFIFKSKTGICGDYATAMTIMAQYAGLCARYTEGFTTTNGETAHSYNVLGNNAHAYVEIFIPGYGFSVFDPTVSDLSDDNNYNPIMAQISTTVREIGINRIIPSVIAMILIYILFIIFKPVIMDFVLIKRMMGNNKNAVLAFGYLRELLKKRHGREIFTFTGDETADFVYEKYGIDITFLTSAFKRQLFADDNTAMPREDILKTKALIRTIRKNRRKTNA